jgi:hypothetical protein
MRSPVHFYLHKTSALVLIALVAMAASVSAATVLDAAYGMPVEGLSSRSAAMGSVGVSHFTGVGALVQNPALLGSLEGKGHVELSLGIRQVNEDRFQPLFDSFSSFTNETAVAVNRNSYAGVHGGVLYGIGEEAKMAVGVGLFERYDFDYDYFEEIRDPEGRPFWVPNGVRDQIVQLRDYQIDGRLRSATIGYGMEVSSRFNLGLSVHRYFGEVSQSARAITTEVYEDLLENSPGEASFNHELAGWGFGVGGSANISPRFDVGVSFESAFTVEGALSGNDSLRLWVPFDNSADGIDLGESGDVKIEYPATMRLGATFHPRNQLETHVVVEMVRRFWESVDDEGYRVTAAVPAGTLRDTWDLKLGVEHIFYNGMPVRFGFRYLENYADEDSDRSIFSAGFGYEAAGYRIDVTGQYHRQTSRQDFLFDRTLVIDPNTRDDISGTYPAPSSLSKVEDSTIALVVGVSRAF